MGTLTPGLGNVVREAHVRAACLRVMVAGLDATPSGCGYTHVCAAWARSAGHGMT